MGTGHTAAGGLVGAGGLSSTGEIMPRFGGLCTVCGVSIFLVKVQEDVWEENFVINRQNLASDVSLSHCNLFVLALQCLQYTRS